MSFHYEIIDHERYKYRLVEETSYPVNIEAEFDHALFCLVQGVLTVRPGYAWDGASGPALDTATFMRASCIHDALYQLMRDGVIDRKKHRKTADKIMRQIALQDGMSRSRAHWTYWAVRLGARRAAMDGHSEQVKA